jgi:hypothetical protein
VGGGRRREATGFGIRRAPVAAGGAKCHAVWGWGVFVFLTFLLLLRLLSLLRLWSSDSYRKISDDTFPSSAQSPIFLYIKIVFKSDKIGLNFYLQDGKTSFYEYPLACLFCICY